MTPEGRLSAMQRVDASGAAQETYLSEINYRVDGLISSQKLGNGTTESFGYSNDRLQLTSQTVTKGGNTLLSLSYGYQSGRGTDGKRLDVRQQRSTRQRQRDDKRAEPKSGVHL